MEISQNSERIGSILGIIRGIADQTNLSALNAAIEAAKAGSNTLQHMADTMHQQVERYKV